MASSPNKVLEAIRRLQTPAFPTYSGEWERQWETQPIDNIVISHISHISHSETVGRVGNDAEADSPASGPCAGDLDLHGESRVSLILSGKSGKCGKTVKNESENSDLTFPTSFPTQCDQWEMSDKCAGDARPAGPTVDEPAPRVISGPLAAKLAYALVSADPCPGFRADEWLAAWERALDFLCEREAEATALGWDGRTLLGVHPVVGVNRVDYTGALLMTPKVALIAADTITYANGNKFHRASVPADAVPVWDWGKPKEAAPPAPGLDFNDAKPQEAGDRILRRRKTRNGGDNAA
jgi:hypothetical protein